MDAYCERQGKQPGSVRFLYDGTRVMPGDTPNDVRIGCLLTVYQRKDTHLSLFSWIWMMETVSMLWLSRLEVVKYTSDTDTPHRHKHIHLFSRKK